MKRDHLRMKFFILFSMILIVSLNITPSVAVTNTFTLAHWTNYAVPSEEELGPTNMIYYTFESSNEKVGVNVWILDEGNYTLHLYDKPCKGFEVDDGSHSASAGLWTPPRKDVWYVLFLYNCEDRTQVSEVTVNVYFVTTKTISCIISVYYLIPILGIAVKLLVVFIIVAKHNKRKQSLPEKQSDTTESEQESAQSQNLDADQKAIPKYIYCSSCGNRNTDDSFFCVMCGTKLRR